MSDSSDATEHRSSHVGNAVGISPQNRILLADLARQHVLDPNGFRTRWCVLSLVNTDGLEHLNLLLLFMGYQSSLELISRLPQFPTNFSRPVNFPTWPTKYLSMFLVAH